MPGGGPSAASSLYSGIFSAEGRSSASSVGKDQEKASQGEESKSPEEAITNVASTESAAAPAKPQGSANEDKQHHAILSFSSCHLYSLLARSTRTTYGMT
jgi:hypothetical protein